MQYNVLVCIYFITVPQNIDSELDNRANKISRAAHLILH